MNKHIKKIDLLNMKSRGEEMPQQNQVNGLMFYYQIESREYMCVDSGGYKIELTFSLNSLNDEIEIIPKKPILNQKEREYLSAVIKPFKNKVLYIKKNLFFESEYIVIIFKDDYIQLPYFKINVMYKNMKIGTHYTLEELGL